MKTVLTYGTYDLLHIGHINLLKRARDLGDRLIVGLSTDEFNMGKNKKSIFSYDERKKILESIRYVDFVIPENSWEQKPSDIKNNSVDIFVMGDDWKGKFNEIENICKVVYLPRTKEISTTYLKNKIILDSKEDGKIVVNYPDE